MSTHFQNEHLAALRTLSSLHSALYHHDCSLASLNETTPSSVSLEAAALSYQSALRKAIATAVLKASHAEHADAQEYRDQHLDRLPD